MRAILVSANGGPEQLRIAEVPQKDPGPGQVRIRNKRASVNFADLMAVAGTYPTPGMPFIPGIDTYGVVEAVGQGVDQAWLDKSVIAFVDDGGYAESSLARTELCFEVPADMDADQAGASPLLLGTSYGLFTRATSMNEGARVLVHSAAGGVGSTAVQMARLLGAEKVVGLVSSAEKAHLVEELGAHAVVAAPGTPFAPGVRGAAGGDFDLILNAVGGSSVQEDIEVLAPFGTLVVYGMASGEPGSVRSNQLHPTGRTVAGFSFGQVRRARPAEVAPLMEPALSMLTQKKLRMVIDSVLGLDDAAEAHKRLAARATQGKILLSL